MTRYVIVGNGAAGMAAVLGIREHDTSGTITVVAEEAHPTYFRAGLSEWMHGTIDRSELQVRPASFWIRHGVEVVHTRAIRIDEDGHLLHLAGGRELGWDRLLLATGARPVVPDWPGAHLDGFFTYRSFDDCAAIRDAVQRRPDLPAVIVGGGILGLEFAWDCKGLGVDALMVVRADQVGRPIFDEAAGRLLRQRLRDDGVGVLLDEEVLGFEGDGDRLRRMVTQTGRATECSAVVAAVGVRANTELAAGTRVDVDGQIKVDERLRTSAPDIYAAGDVATVWDPMLGRHVPTRTWEPSYVCGRVAGANMAEADERFTPCTAMNASLVYDLQYVLLGAFMERGPDIEELVAPTSRGPYGYRKLLLKDGVPIGGTFLQDRRQFLVWRRLLETRTDVSAWRDRLFDDDFDANVMLPPGGMDYYFF
jgi:nitrite reductase (NADH) large subunit